MEILMLRASKLFVTARIWRKGFSLAFAVALIVCAFSRHVLADDRQYKVEAAFLYNFFNYVTWPGDNSPQTSQNRVICVYGSDPIIPYLNYIRDKRGTEHSFTVVDLATASQLPICDMLFMRHTMSDDVHKYLKSNTLTVLKPDDPLDHGGMIELVQDGERIAIKINQSQLEQNGFQISSRLLELAQVER